jgi:hypothetical protein
VHPGLKELKVRQVALDLLSVDLMVFKVGRALLVHQAHKDLKALKAA